ALAAYWRAVDGCSCIKPTAPLDETTLHRKLDSVATTPFTKAAGTPCFRAVAAISACISSICSSGRLSLARRRWVTRFRRATGAAGRLEGLIGRVSRTPAKPQADTEQANKTGFIECFMYWMVGKTSIPENLCSAGDLLHQRK